MGAPAGRSDVPRRAGRWADRYARFVVGLRWWVIGTWAAGSVLALVLFPSLSEAGGGAGLKGLLSVRTPAVQTEIRSLEIFGFPLVGRTVVVQRDPGGLTIYDRARTVNNAAAVDAAEYKEFERLGPLRGALPLTNALRLFPASNEQGTTAVTYLFYGPGVSFNDRLRSARVYADTFFRPRDNVVGVTGSVPARAKQGRIIRDNLALVEAATLGAIIVIVGLSFRSVVAPVVALCTTAVAYTLTLRVSGILTQVFDFTSPSELEPVVVALLLGVVTDYVVFFCSALRHEIGAAGVGRHEAARRATARVGPIVAVAGLAVVAGTGVLLVAESTFFRALGPSLMFTVLVGLCVSMTLVPALMAVSGRAIFWPDRPARPARGAKKPIRGWISKHSPIAAIANSRSVAAVTTAGCVAALTVAAVPIANLELGVSFVESLPSSAGIRKAAVAAQTGFAPGILSPTVVLVEGRDVARQRDELATLGDLIEDQPGVSGVIGPADLPDRIQSDILLAPHKGAARFMVVLGDDPLGATAIDTVRHLSAQLPGLLARSDLDHASAGVAGDTATAAYIVEQTESDILRIGVAALLANLLMLLLFLRALVAALYLLAASVLSLTASLGLTTWIFDQINPGQGLTFYVPFAAAVLLLAFGSDYNIFGVGQVWAEARRRTISDAIKAAMPQSTSAITTAGVALAASFGLLAIIPLAPFRQLAFVMSAGILLDVLVVRMLLLPALLTLVGPAGAWPSKRLRTKLSRRRRVDRDGPRGTGES